MDWKKLKQKFEENPLPYILAAGLLLSATAKFIDAAGAAQGRRAYAKQVDYRVRQGK